jgi:hypothetical protein
MPDETKEVDKTAHDLSSLVYVINQILAAADCPEKFRGYIDCLVGLSKGKYEFEAKDEDVAKHTRPDKKGIKDDSAKRWVSRMRGELNDWQDKNGLVFIEGKPGHKVGIMFISSSYRLPLIKYAEQVIDEARKDILWRSNPQQAIRNAAQDLINKLNPSRVQKSLKIKRRDYREVHRGLSAARTNLEKVMKYLKDNDAGIHDSKTYDGHVKLIDELEQLIQELRGRIGYYGEWPS